MGTHGGRWGVKRRRVRQTGKEECGEGKVEERWKWARIEGKEGGDE